MNPQETENLIGRYNDPGLASRERARLDRMLADNPDLRGILQQYQRLDQALGRLPDGLDRVDLARFSRRIHEAVAQAQGPRSSRISLRRYLAPLAAAAAAIIIVALSVFLPRDHQSSQPAGNLIAVVELAQPQILITKTNIKNEIGAILPPKLVTTEDIMLTDEPAGGVICVVKPEQADQFQTSRVSGIFDLILDGSS